MPAAKKKLPERKEPRGRVIRLRPANSKSSGLQDDGVAQFSLQHEMLGLLQRLSGNKSKRTATVLIDVGPVRAFMVAVDEGGTLDEDAVKGNASLQVLIGEVDVKVGRKKRRLHVGDLLVLEAGSAGGAEAIDPSVLLITVAVGAANA